MCLTPWRLRAAVAATVTLSLVVGSAVIWQATYAAFTATTGNAGNSWTAGSVSIANDSSGSAAFTVTTARPDSSLTVLAPGATGPFVAGSTSSGGSACVKVTYTGDLAADIRLHATRTEIGSNGGLGSHLLFSVDTGTDPAGGIDRDCTTFTDADNASYIFGSATNSSTYLSSFGTTYATGAGGWTGATQNSARWYRFSWLLPADVGDDAGGQQVQVTFTWEAQNT